MEKTLFINEDDSHFTSCHPREDMCLEGLERLVDFYAEGTQVGGILFCVNYQKALYKSEVWEYICDGYDPEGPDDQPFLKDVDLSLGWHGRHMFDNMLALDKQNLDRYKIWLDRCRFHGIEGWLTIRMNDCHGLQEYRHRQNGSGDYRGWALMFPSEYWKTHPELTRALYNEERSMEGAFDYAQEVVRQHHLALIKEILERWDMDGLELDWMRWGMNFKPGYEEEGKAILTEFIGNVKELVKKAEKRLGHSIKLGVRIPWELEVCEALGYDPMTWSDKYLIDQLVLSSFNGSACFTYPLSIWRRIFGENVRILGHCSDYIVPYTAFGLAGQVTNNEINNGVAASALNRGIDGLYFFNSCYQETFKPEQFKKMLQTVGAEDSLRKHPRRHILSHSAAAPGLPARESLPIPLVNPSFGYDYNRLEHSVTLRLDTGFKPNPDDSITLYLGFSDKLELSSSSEVRCNGSVLKYVNEICDTAILNNSSENCKEFVNKSIPFLTACDIPYSYLKSGENVFELISFTGNIELRWAEVFIQS